MGFCAQFRALVRKNFILWYRNLCGSICELAYPFVLLLLLVAIKSGVENKEYAEQSYVSPAGLAYYLDSTVKTTTDRRTAAAYVKLGLNPGNPFSECLKYNMPLIAYVGSHPMYSRIETALFSSTGGSLPL